MFKESEADWPAQNCIQNPLRGPSPCLAARLTPPVAPAGSSHPFELIIAGWFLRHIQVTVPEQSKGEGK